MPGAQVVGSGGRTTGALEIVRVELGFDAGLGEATVPRGARLNACGVARFDGNGLFRATWEVDGRALEEVVVHVVFGNTMRVCTGAGTVLPTFEPGPHQVALRVHEPQPRFQIPAIRYFVTGERQRQE